jgi:hypothetical protein
MIATPASLTAGPGVTAERTVPAAARESPRAARAARCWSGAPAAPAVTGAGSRAYRARADAVRRRPATAQMSQLNALLVEGGHLPRDAGTIRPYVARMVTSAVQALVALRPLRACDCHLVRSLPPTRTVLHNDWRKRPSSCTDAESCGCAKPEPRQDPRSKNAASALEGRHRDHTVLRAHHSGRTGRGELRTTSNPAVRALDAM